MDEDDAYDAAVVLTEMISWIRKHQDMLPYFDMVTLLTAEKFMNKDNYGEDYIHILGVAYLGGACNKTYMGASIVTDSGNWEGVRSPVHFTYTVVKIGISRLIRPLMNSLTPSILHTILNADLLPVTGTVRLE